MRKLAIGTVAIVAATTIAMADITISSGDVAGLVSAVGSAADKTTILTY